MRYHLRLVASPYSAFPCFLAVHNEAEEIQATITARDEFIYQPLSDRVLCAYVHHFLFASMQPWSRESNEIKSLSK